MTNILPNALANPSICLPSDPYTPYYDSVYESHGFKCYPYTLISTEDAVTHVGRTRAYDYTDVDRMWDEPKALDFVYPMRKKGVDAASSKYFPEIGEDHYLLSALQGFWSQNTSIVMGAFGFDVHIGHRDNPYGYAAFCVYNPTSSAVYAFDERGENAFYMYAITAEEPVGCTARYYIGDERYL